MPHKQPHHIKRLWVIGLSVLMLAGIVSVTPSLLAWSIDSETTAQTEITNTRTYNASTINTLN